MALSSALSLPLWGATLGPTRSWGVCGGDARSTGAGRARVCVCRARAVRAELSQVPVGQLRLAAGQVGGAFGF